MSVAVYNIESHKVGVGFESVFAIVCFAACQYGEKYTYKRTAPLDGASLHMHMTLPIFKRKPQNNRSITALFAPLDI